MTIKPFLFAISMACLALGCANSPPTEPTPGGTQGGPAPSYTIYGVVSELTPAGRAPVVGVSVRETTGSRSAITDAEGRYSIVNVPLQSTSTTISASKAGYNTSSATQQISGDTRVDIQLDRRTTYTLSGVISETTANGPAGIEGVAVYFFAYVSNDYYAEGMTTTDEKGRYRLTGLWSGADVYTDIWLTKSGYRIGVQTNPPCDNCFRTVTITGDTVLDIQLERLATSHGGPS